MNNEPQKFTKKPMTIEAMYLGEPNTPDGIAKWCGGVVKGQLADASGPLRIEIETLEGVMTASKGDWIIKGIKGEFYPCKPDIFEQTCDPESEHNALIDARWNREYWQLIDATITELTKERDALQQRVEELEGDKAIVTQLLEASAKRICDAVCPTKWKSGEARPHSDLCKDVATALILSL